jgi:hypothetical protein
LLLNAAGVRQEDKKTERNSYQICQAYLNPNSERNISGIF